MNPEFDAVVIGGGPAGGIVASLMAQAGHRVIILERDIHPRDHVGESLTPSTNPIFKRIGFLEKMEDAGFVHKRGACWTAPNAPVGKYISILLGEFPPPGATQTYTYNVERDIFDALLLRHAHELGARVIQGATVQEVIFRDGRAIGVRYTLADASRQELFAKVVIDASGRRCLLASQLGLKKLDPAFNQFVIYSWFKGLRPVPAGTEGMLFLHFLGMERAWAWQIPLRNDVWSIGIVTDKADFKKSGVEAERYVSNIVARNRSFQFAMQDAVRIRPWWAEGDYSYSIAQISGSGWLLIGDALRFVDPVFSTGVDVAAYSALYAFEAIDAVLHGSDESNAFLNYERRVNDGVDAWYDLIALFYKLQNLFTYFALRSDYREQVVRILQGNLYQPETLQRARDMIALMNETYERVMQDPANLFRPLALSDAANSALNRRNSDATLLPT